MRSRNIFRPLIVLSFVLSAIPAMAVWNGETLPIFLSVMSETRPIPTYAVAVSVESVPSGGGAVQVSTDRPDLLSSPSGSWPYTLAFPANGGTTQSFYATASTVTQSTTVHIY